MDNPVHYLEDPSIVPRPPKLTDELECQMVKLFSDGRSVATACAAVGIHPNTFYRWLKDGEDELNIYQHRFLLAITAARGNHFGQLETKVSRSAKHGIVTDTYRYKVIIDEKTGEQTVVKYLYQTVREDGAKLALDVLSRQNPAQWARKTQVDHTSSDGSILDIVGEGGNSQRRLTAGARGYGDDGGGAHGAVDFDLLSVELLQRVVSELESDGRLSRETQLAVLHELATAGENVIDVEAKELEPKVAARQRRLKLCAVSAGDYE